VPTARSVRPFVLRNKTDAADAQAIWTAVQQPGACLVAIRQADQQVILSLHRIRAQLLKFRIMQSNGLRGLFYEFGVVLPEGYAQLCKAVPQAFADAECQVPPMLLDSLRDQREGASLHLWREPLLLVAGAAWYGALSVLWQMLFANQPVQHSLARVFRELGRYLQLKAALFEPLRQLDVSGQRLALAQQNARFSISHTPSPILDFGSLATKGRAISCHICSRSCGPLAVISVQGVCSGAIA